MRTYAVCTTFAKRHWNEGLAKECVESLWRRWPACVRKLVYVDGGIPPELERLPVEVHDLDHNAGPGVFKKRYADVTKPLVWRDGRYDYRFDAVRFAHKVFALHDASHRAGDVLIWLDADVVTHHDVPLDFLEEITEPSKPITALLRNDWPPECGFVSWNENAGRTFLQRFRDLYVTGDVFKYPEWHDGYLFGRLVAGMPVRNLAEGCAEKHVWPHTVLAQYMTHFKGPRRKTERRDVPDAEALQSDIAQHLVAEVL